MIKFAINTTPEFVEAVDGKWLSVQGVKFEFHPDGICDITLTENLHNARVVDSFSSGTNSQRSMSNTLPL